VELDDIFGEPRNLALACGGDHSRHASSTVTTGS